jgi:hypothetical protein
MKEFPNSTNPCVLIHAERRVLVIIVRIAIECTDRKATRADDFIRLIRHEVITGKKCHNIKIIQRGVIYESRNSRKN